MSRIPGYIRMHSLAVLGEIFFFVFLLHIFAVHTKQSAGLVLADTELMTGLPEYRNGGLLLDMGLLQAKYPEVTSQPHSPEDEVSSRSLKIWPNERLAKGFPGGK